MIRGGAGPKIGGDEKRRRKGAVVLVWTGKARRSSRGPSA